MNKVKITVEQEKALKEWKAEGLEFEWFVCASIKGGWSSSLEPLNDITPEDFSHMLNGWYEVEQPFKVGDWFLGQSSKLYAVIIGITDKTVKIKYTDGTVEPHFPDNIINHYEKVEEPYKIMLLELGRKKPEFATGDKYSTDDGKHYSIKDGSHTLECLQFFKDGVVEYFYPVESRIEVKYNV